jgi:signal transduction histidine kinase
VDIPESLPPIDADCDAIQQILIHLLQNASSASPPEGEIYLQAQFKSEHLPPEYILLQVSDQGGGIAAEDLPRVFSRLYRMENPPITGLGESSIGLSIVKTLVEAHGGRIWVDTEQNKGSTFSVLLPTAMPNNSGGEEPVQ